MAFGGIPFAAGAGIRSSDRIRAQLDADDTQLVRAQRRAQAKTPSSCSGTDFISKFSISAVPNETIVANASKLGVSLGMSPNQIVSSVERIKSLDLQRTLIMLKKEEEKARTNSDTLSSLVMDEADELCEDLLVEEQAGSKDQEGLTTVSTRAKRTVKKRALESNATRKSARLKNKQK
jgi:hypothetical protein